MDDYYLAHKRPILLLVAGCNLVVYLTRFLLTGQAFGNATWMGWTLVSVYFAGLFLGAFAKSRRTSFVALTILLGLYAFDMAT